MAVGGYVYTYPDVARRESLLDAMNMLDPTDTQFLSGIKQSAATNTLHEWIIDSLETVGANAQPEGGDAPADVANDPTRPQNVLQIFARTAKITGTELEVNRVGGSRMSRELMKKMKVLKGDIEYALIRGSIASGLATNVSSATATRRLRGVKSWITTNVTNVSGTSLTETILNDVFQLVWDKGANTDAVYTPMKGKRRVSAFAGPAGTTKQVDLADRRLVNAVDVYQSDAAKMVKLFPHRYVTIGIGTGGAAETSDYVTTATPGFDLLALQEDTWATAWFRRPFTKQLAVTGDFEAKELIAEVTLEARQQAANAQANLLF